MILMYSSGIPAALNCAASKLAMRGTSPRLWTVGISITCWNRVRVLACQAGSSLDGIVRGSVAAMGGADRQASNKAAMGRMTFPPFGLLARQFAEHDLPMDDIVVQGLDRQPFVLAMGAEIDRKEYPRTIGAVDWDSGHPERPGVARAGRHFREDQHPRVQRMDRLVIGGGNVGAQRRSPPRHV